MVTPGDLALANFPFSESATVIFKRRPVLVVAAEGSVPNQAIWVAMVTGNSQRFLRPQPGDIRVAEWEGLLDKESVVRTRRVWTAEQRDIVRVLGPVLPETLAAVRAEIADVLDMTPN